MDLSTLTSADLGRIADLLNRKQSLVSEVEEIDSELQSISGSSTAKRAVAASAPKGGRGRRGALKENIIDLLQSAGKSGTTVKDIAKATKRNPANIYTWFFTTGKKIKNIKKLGGATYAWVG